MEVSTVAAKLSRSCFRGIGFRKYSFYLVGGRLKFLAKMDPQAKFLSFGFWSENPVVRDDQGRSPYAIVMANPRRVHPTQFCSKHLDQVVVEIGPQSGELAQVVNYNIENYQYVVAMECTLAQFVPFGNPSPTNQN